MKNIFFKKKNNIKINDILQSLNIKKLNKNFLVNDIREIDEAGKNDITFFSSLKYLDSINKTKSKLVITNKKFYNFIPKKIRIFEVNNILLSVAKITSIFYPNALDDDFDLDVNPINKKKIIKSKIGRNILIGKNVNIGKNCSIGHNTIIEKNVIIGDNCKIGCNVILKNTILGKNTNILDGSIIGKKGFGFFPNKDKNIRYPHIGAVIIGNDV